MREISFVKKLNFNFNGGVTKKALVLGDADNDKHNELICASLQGDLAVFKGTDPDKYAYATGLGMVTACVVGDIINVDRNYIAAINTEGWLFIFHLVSQSDMALSTNAATSDNIKPSNNENPIAKPDEDSSLDDKAIKLQQVYEQRMPSNCKELLLADLDGDGQNEVIIGLTDRVLRTYKWIKIAGSERGKFVGLYKWEFADQIGAVSINPSRHENCQDIIVAQPGGTYARLECYEKKITPTNECQQFNLEEQKNDLLEDDNDNVKSKLNKLTPEYHLVQIRNQMRNHHISTEVLGGIKDEKNSDSYSLIVIATLDGTLMLVNKDEILWSLQVDHQLFALGSIEHTKSKQPRNMLSQSESTCTIVPNLSVVDTDCKTKEKPNQYFVVCAWNGKTWIFDEDRNYLRFFFTEAVSAFTAGTYCFDDQDQAVLVYATFNNQIILYYDVILDNIKPIYALNEVLNNSSREDLLGDIKKLYLKLNPTTQVSSINSIRDLLQDILYSIRD